MSLSLRAPVLFAAVSALLLASPAMGAWRIAPPAASPSALVEVENRFIPGFLRRGEGNQAAPTTDQALRIEQLEAQVRSLTGQVEELTFAVRQLQQAAGAAPLPATTGNAPGTQGSLSPASSPALAPPPATGAPAPLGSTTASAPLDPAQTGAAAPQGPIDLSAINQGLPSAAPSAARGLPGVEASPDPLGGGAPAQAAVAPQSPGSATTSEIAAIRTLQDSGRYGRAAEEARNLLAQNPGQGVAAEARFLLGEALLAQGDYRTAANYFLENYTADPTGARGPDSLLKLGTALNGLGESGAACSSLEELLEAHPNASPALRAEAERQRVAANCT